MTLHVSSRRSRRLRSTVIYVSGLIRTRVVEIPEIKCGTSSSMSKTHVVNYWGLSQIVVAFFDLDIYKLGRVCELAVTVPQGS